MGIPITIRAPEGKSELGVKLINMVVSLLTVGSETWTKETVTATPCKSGVGFKLV